MKKRVWKAVGLLMALCLMFALVGCSASDKEKLVGSWKCNMDMTGMMNAMMESELGELAEYFEISEFALVMNFTFDKAGTYVCTIDEDSAVKAAETLRADMVAGVTAMLEEMLDGTGISVEDALEMSGTSMDEMVEEMDVDSLIEELMISSEGVYDAEDGKLYMTEGDTVDESEYVLYTQDGNTFTITEFVGVDDMEELAELLPMVFTKQ